MSMDRAATVPFDSELTIPGFAWCAEHLPTLVANDQAIKEAVFA